MKRREAREAAFKMIYCYASNRDCEQESFYTDMLEDLEIEDDAYVKATFFGVYEKIDEIDVLLSENAKGWKLERMTSISRSLMRLCVYEMKYASLACNIAINEAVELAKRYDIDSAPSFINGVLNMIAEKEGLKAVQES